MSRVFRAPFTLRKSAKFRTICPPATCPMSSGNAMPVLPLLLRRISWRNIFIWTEATGRSLDGLRGDHNRLGFALMLGSARFLGVFPGADVEIPSSVTAFLVSQLGLQERPVLKGYFDLGRPTQTASRPDPRALWLYRIR